MKLNLSLLLNRSPHHKRGVGVLLVLILFPICTFAYDVHLSVPFKAQVPPGAWKNTRNCGQTSVLMVASLYKGTAAGEQGIKDIDDWLLTRFGDPIRDYNGSYTDVDKLAVLAREFFGFADASSHRNWTLADLRNELSLGHPVIVAVWTNMNTGSNADGTKNVPHFMVLVGMNDNIVIVNDPGHTHGNDNQYDLAQFQRVWATQKSAVVVIPSPASVPSGKAYITNFDSYVSVIDTTTNTAVGTIGLTDPRGVAVNSSGTRVYITTTIADALSVVDTATNAIVATIPVGHLPIGVAIAKTGNRAYVANEGSNSVSVIDTATNTVLHSIPVGQCPWGVAVNPLGTRVYVTNVCSASVSVIDTSSDSVIATLPTLASAQGVVVNSAGTRAYVAEGGANNVSVIDTATNTVLERIFLQGGTCACPATSVAVSPDGTKAYMSHFGLNSIAVIDLNIHSVITYIPVGNDPEGIALNSNGTRLYVANSGSGTVSVINTSTNSVVATVVVAGRPLAFGQFIGP